MSLMNSDRLRQRLGGREPPKTRYTVHKRSERAAPRLSIVLLDWSCRESLHALDWLQKQSVPRESYELLWIDLYDRVPPEALAEADAVITLGQRGLYHKHIGYNVGLLEARGDLVTVCDSDAVFPEDFVESILNSFEGPEVVSGRALAPGSSPGAARSTFPTAGRCPDAQPGASARPLRSQVLMHYEARTALQYPPRLDRADELKDPRWKWRELHPNAGACMTVRREDAIRFGGFDEHRSFRGYLCGPYDLGWRLVNAGLPEVWHDPSVILWHFAHPDPVGSSGVLPSLRTRLETIAPHVDLHALTAVEHFSTGQVLPRQENSEIHALRLAARQIGTAYEANYATLPLRQPLSRWQRFRLTAEMAGAVLMAWGLETIGQVGRRLLGGELWERVKNRLPAARAGRSVTNDSANDRAAIKASGARYCPGAA